ncbi:HoxN/HupN/NixA family nickel/cobalt transporter [Granulicella cerasi]|uniref:Nickel/cobalt efflux system n=1 Tax=Granulicella cerasi TaxID=741063 RepID=A0ABW1ZAI1_9BACT|nr:HoxN/HupN/NixA family nickel/cobalt transporter [Granulicella cerasi]
MKIFSLRASWRSLRSRGLVLCIGLLLFNIVAWLWALAVFHGHPVLLGTAFLAYSFGLRHAVDADHIAAIDNVTRKLMQQGQQPVTVGLLFSLGHSTIVVIGSVLMASGTLLLQHRLAAFRDVGSIIGTCVSVAFLFGIAVLNLGVFRSVYASFTRVRKGAPYIEVDADALLANGGLLSRLLRPVFGMVQQSWHMYPLGVLFGLGFDTATEIGLLSISATEASRGVSLHATLVFPVLFAAGMSLVDTADNLLMIGAYGWAFVKPVRKLYYNMTLTLVSVVVAFAIGGVEAAGLLADQFHLRGSLWDLTRSLNDNLGRLGYGIIAFFVLSWLLSALIYRWNGFDDLNPADASPE